MEILIRNHGTRNGQARQTETVRKKHLMVDRSSMLRQAISRINIQRGKKLNAIAKKKDDICKHLESGNEMNAKVWVTIMHSS